MGVVHSAQVVAGPVELGAQPDGPPELLHRLDHQLRPLVVRHHCGQLLQDQAPVIQRLQHSIAITFCRQQSQKLMPVPLS